MAPTYKRLSVVRKALMWWFEWPANPYVCISSVVDFSHARSFIDRLNSQGRLNSHGNTPVTVQHLLLAIIAVLYEQYPDANSRIVGKRIQRLDHVNVAMPVSLEGYASGVRPDLSMGILERINGLSLRQIAAACEKTVSAERSGRQQNPFVRVLTGLIDRTPYPLLAQGLNLLNGLRRIPMVAEQFNRQVDVSTALSNPGGAFDRVEGAFLRGISLAIPQRLFYIGTIWGIGAIQDEVIAVEGQPKVRPVLPVILVFDHRLFDGIVAGRILTRFAEMIRAPEVVFGEDGRSVER